MKKLFLLLFLLNQIVVAQEKDVITPGANLVVEGIPPIPAMVAAQMKPYTESRAATFCAWHPEKREMLIATRFANVPQLHWVKLPLGARKQLTFFDEPVTNASFDPVNGDYFLFNRDAGGNEFTQIYLFDVKNGKTSLLTDGKRSQNMGIRWNNAGNRIAYSSTSRNGADRDLYVMNPRDPAGNKMVLQVEGGGWSVLDWSPDDKQLLVFETISVNESYYWLLDLATGTKTELSNRKEKGIAVGDGRFSRDGKGIYFVTDRDNEFRRLAYMDLKTKNINYFTSGIPWDVDNFDLSRDGKQIAFIANEAGESGLYLMNTVSKKITRVPGLPTGVYGGLSFHRNSRDLSLSINNARSSNDIYVLQTTTGKFERWTESELGGIIAEELQLPELIRWKSFDGLEITGFYYKPPPRFSGKRPVMIAIHGGPEGQALPTFMGANNYFINELGIAIIFPNVRGSYGYGKTFLTLDNGMKREESVKDIGTLLDWIERQPGLDASRIMVTGGSYGGYMTLAVATHYNDRIRCALDVVGISHFGTFLKNTESYRRDLRRVEYGDERDPQIAAFFEKIAPLNNASRITKPLFIVQGGNDPRVPRTEALQMAEKVRNNGGVVWYLEAKDEGHGFRKKNNADFQRYATALFINKYLLDGMETNTRPSF